MTETTTEMTREELEAELARRETSEKPAEQADRTTRERSAIKPQDHKPAAAEIQIVEHGGVTFEVTRNVLDDLRTLDMLERGMITSSLRRIVTDKKFEEFLEKNPGANTEAAAALLEAITDKVGAKN